ncbi:MAG: heme exporter protein CcmD [Pseudomonadota bacterium]
MMPELGKYAAEVSLAYVISIALVLGIVALTVWRSRRVRRALEDVEERRRSNG